MTQRVRRNTTDIIISIRHIYTQKRDTFNNILCTYAYINIRRRYCLNRRARAARITRVYTYNNNIRRIIINRLISGTYESARAVLFSFIAPCTVISSACACICILYLSARREVPPATDKTPPPNVFRCTATMYIIYNVRVGSGVMGTVVGKTRIAKLSNASAAVRAVATDDSSSLYPLFGPVLAVLYKPPSHIEFIIVEQYNITALIRFQCSPSAAIYNII